MPFVTIKRLSFGTVDLSDLPEYTGVLRNVAHKSMREKFEKEIKEAIANIPELEITPDKVMVSIPVEQPRGGDWWQNPTVEIVFADAELRTPQVKKATLDTACRVV